MRAAICSCLALALLAALVPLAGATSKPALRLVHTRPVTVHGAHFGAYERVRVTLRKPSGEWRHRVRAGAAGTFSARFRGVVAGRCAGFSVTARGRSGARATFLRRAPVSCEGAPAAPAQKVSASPRPVHFGETLTIRGSRWPVIEFCRRKVRLTLTTSQQAFRIGAVRTRDDGSFTFHYVPRKRKVGAGLWRLRARMRCESGKDGSTIFTRASVRFRIKS